MVFVTFALVSLLIVIPIVYFLSLGISVKWKISIVGISFIIANIGLLTRIQFELWQSFLILLLLVTLSSFLLIKRLGESSNLQNNKQTSLHTFSEEDKDVQIKKIEKQSPELKEAINLTKENLTSEKIDDDHENLSLDEDQFHEDEYSQPIEVIDDLIKEEKYESIEEISPQNNVVEHHIPVAEDDTLDMDEDISFLLNRDEIFNKDEPNESDFIDNNSESDQEVGYMSEIEKMLEETDIEAEENTVYTQIEEVKEMESLEEIVIRKNNVEKQIVEEKTSISDEEVEIEELVFQK